MFNRILIPTDFSTASEWIFDDAVRIAGASSAELLILHVRMTWSSHPDELRFPADPSLYEYAEKLELERLRERARRANASVSTRLIVRQGPDPGDEICKTAVEEKVDLIVIATHARHHVAHLFVGSTTLNVISDPPTPVMAIRYGTRKRSGIRRAVVPIHLEQTTRAALDLAARVVTEENGELHLITVCREGEHARALEILRAIAPSATHAVVKGSDAAKEIVRYAQKVDADAVFLNADRAPSEEKLDIVRHSPAPVIVVPSPEC